MTAPTKSTEQHAGRSLQKGRQVALSAFHFMRYFFFANSKTACIFSCTAA